MVNEKRLDLIDRNVLKTLFDVRYDTAFIQERTRENKEQWSGYCTGINWGRNTIADAPTVDAVEVVRGYHEGDVCIYSFAEKNKSLAIVEIVRILDDERGVAEVKFLKVFVDDTRNGMFDYLLRTGKTMNASFKYLKNITPNKHFPDGDANKT